MSINNEKKEKHFSLLGWAHPNFKRQFSNSSLKCKLAQITEQKVREIRTAETTASVGGKLTIHRCAMCDSLPDDQSQKGSPQWSYNCTVRVVLLPSNHQTGLKFSVSNEWWLVAGDSGWAALKRSTSDC